MTKTTLTMGKFIDPFTDWGFKRIFGQEASKAFSDRMRLVYFTLPLFRKGADGCETNLERWIYTLKNMTTLKDIPFLADNPVFRYLADVADISALSQKDRQRYDESIKTMRDHISAYETAINKGLAEGVAKGRSEGLSEGSINIARRMLMDGEPIDKVHRYTGLSQEEIVRLIKGNKG